jgi:excinuclease UvrABC nuclease subunit
MDATALSALPETTGCYWFEDADGTVMYAGKSVNLRKRVASYYTRLALTDPRDNYNTVRNYTRKLECMVRFIKKIGFIETETELDALLLEHSLIKQHRPMYNEAMRHDRKSWFIHMTTEADFTPPLSRYREVSDANDAPLNEGSEIGPFYNEYALNEALHAIADFWQLPRCGKTYPPKSSGEPCLRHHMKNCLAPCAGMADKTEYRQRFTEAAAFFQGERDAAHARALLEMEFHAENMDFERAAKIRDTYAAIRLWAGRLAKFPTDWYAKYVVFAKAHRETLFIATYAAEGMVKAWVYIDADSIKEAQEVFTGLGWFILDDAEQAGLCVPNSLNAPNLLHVPNTAEEGKQKWAALADISAIKRYVKLPSRSTTTEDATVLLNKTAEEITDFLYTSALEFVDELHSDDQTS